MLNLVTGVPGACKTAYVVTQLDNLEKKNKINLKKNITIYQHNKKYFDKYSDDFTYYEYETGSGHTLKRELSVLSDDYFDILGQEFDSLRPDDYYLRSVQYNEIIERIRDRSDIEQFYFFQPVRTIYTNIKALKIDHVRDLVVDWRECPDGSVIVIDEVQLVPPYNANKTKDDPVVQELTIHRHRGFDFYFITQAASYLHPTIKELISCHLHITRPYWRTPKVYQYGSLRAYPNTLVNKLNCESKFTFKPKDHIFKLYKSTSIDTSKKRFPVGLFGFGAFVVLALSVFLYGLSGGAGFMGHFFGSDEDVSKNNTGSSAGPAPSSSSASSHQEVVDLSLECRKGANVEKPECVQWFNDLSKKSSSVDPQKITVSYNPDKPYDFAYVPDVQPTDFPRMSGVIRLSSGQLMAVDQQGNYMPQISAKDCQRWLDGYRPFDYFAQSQQQQQKGRSAPEQQNSDSQSSFPDDNAASES